MKSTKLKIPTQAEWLLKGIETLFWLVKQETDMAKSVIPPENGEEKVESHKKRGN